MFFACQLELFGVLNHNYPSYCKIINSATCLGILGSLVGQMHMASLAGGHRFLEEHGAMTTIVGKVAVRQLLGVAQTNLLLALCIVGLREHARLRKNTRIAQTNLLLALLILGPR